MLRDYSPKPRCGCCGVDDSSSITCYDAKASATVSVSTSFTFAMYMLELVVLNLSHFMPLESYALISDHIQHVRYAMRLSAYQPRRSKCSGRLYWLGSYWSAPWPLT
jgi:hypothetical protein